MAQSRVRIAQHIVETARHAIVILSVCLSIRLSHSYMDCIEVPRHIVELYTSARNSIFLQKHILAMQSPRNRPQTLLDSQSFEVT